ncbi:MAG: T9SS type A sorting domain-containing protein [Candidatus Kapabacteria bacterium]|nr:T9SS type A sorting domain-containing protein [Candidatus Kapabacteria bacterium]
MKKLFTLLFTVIVLTNFSNAQHVEDWHVLFSGISKNKNVQNTYIYKIQILNKNYIGFINNDLYISSDGGLSFSNTTNFNKTDSISKNIQDWVFVSANTILTLVDSSIYTGTDGMNLLYDYKTCIYKTTNGGKNWEVIPINSNWRSRQSKFLSMADSLNGIMIQYPSKYDAAETTDILWITNDGWKTRNKVKVHPQLIGSIKIKFFPPSTIVIATAANTLYKTIDLGNKWEKIQISKDLILNGIDLYFVNDSLYYFVTNANTQITFKAHSKLYKTINSGNKWNLIYDKTGADSAILSLSFVNDSSFYMSGPILRYTSNSCNSYNELYNAYIDNNENIISNIRTFSDNTKIALASISYIIKFSGNYTLLPPKFFKPDSMYNNSLDFELKWNPIIGANRYHIQIVEREELPPLSLRPPTDFDTTLFANDSIISGTSYKLNGTRYQKEYSCRIRAINETQLSQWLMNEYNTVYESLVENTNKFDKINFSPNPASDFITITNNQLQITNVEIYNAFGERMKNLTPTISEGEGVGQRIDISSLPSGIYYCCISAGIQRITKSFVVLK